MYRLTNSLLYPIGLVVLLIFANACKKEEAPKEAIQEAPYTGPILSFQDIVTEYSQKGAAKIILKAPEQFRMQNNDEYFPAGVHLDVYGENGGIKTVLDADSGKYLSEDRLYVMMGAVKVTNIIEEQSLETPILYWDERYKEIYTDTIVKITTTTEIINGVGMRAKQDFSQYKIVKPTGIISAKSAGNQ